MKILYNADVLFILLAFIATISIFTYPLNTFPLRVLPCFLMLFLLPGYALASALYPYKKFGLIKHLLLSIILSVSLTLIFTAMTIFGFLTISSTITFIILAAFTIIMAFIALKRRINLKRYIKCKSCDGYYLLRKGETLEDFESCTCGGELEYASYKPAQKDKKRSVKFPSTDVLLIIVLTFITVIVLAVPQLNTSVIRMLFVPILLFFLSGYALTAAVYPYKNSISMLKRFLLSIGFSAVVLFLSTNLFIYLFKIYPSSIFIFSLSILTVALILIAFIRRFKTPKKPWIKDFKKENKEAKFMKSKINIKNLISTKKSRYKGIKSSYLDLILIFLIAILSVFSVITPVLNESFIRTILGLLFILFLSGYSLIAALFPKMEDLDGIERAALSFGLSIVVASLIGLSLNYTSFGIKLTSILISLSVFTISMIFIAFLRRKRIPERERFSVDFAGFFKSIISSFNTGSQTDKILSIVLVVSIILAFSMTVYIIVSPKEGEKFTEFYILGPEGKASDYPINLTAGQKGTVIIGVINHEYKNTAYSLVLKLNNRTINQQNITLINKEKYENTFNFTVPSSREKQKLEFLLYKLPDENTVYRSLHLWINVK